MTLDQFRAELYPRFSYMEPVIDSVYYAITKKKNMILHGPGGHAKSSLVEAALELFVGADKFYSDVFMTTAAEDMDVTPIMGYDNIPKYQKDGVLEKVLDDTIFLKHRFAVLEEGLDAPGMLITALKDPLMRGYVCINGKCHPNKLETLFICTNVNPTTWAGSDNSRLALLQRFTFSAEVKWPSYTVKEFAPFLKKRGMNNLIVAQFGEICHQNKYPISPRSLETLCDIYTSFGLAGLRNFEDMPPAVYDKLQAYEKNIPYIAEIQALEERVTRMINNVSLTATDIVMEATDIVAAAKKVKGIPLDGSFSEQLRAVISIANQARDVANEARKQMKV